MTSEQAKISKAYLDRQSKGIATMMLAKRTYQEEADSNALEWTKQLLNKASLKQSREFKADMKQDWAKLNALVKHYKSSLESVKIPDSDSDSGGLDSIIYETR